MLGAEQGPKADPTTTTYVPRPEWYFFFLFELLRVIKPPELVADRDDRHPDDLHGPAAAAAVLRPQPGADPLKRPIATTAGILTIIAMAFLTFLGANAGSPTRDRPRGRPEYETGQARRRPVGLPRLPQVRRERQRRPGPGADRDRRAAARRGDRALAARRPRDHAVLHAASRRRSWTTWSTSSPRSTASSARGGLVPSAVAGDPAGARPPATTRSSPARSAACSTASPASTT